MRELIDPVSPEALRPMFQGSFDKLRRGKALEPMLFLNGAYLLALDGTGYFSSKTIHCTSWSAKGPPHRVHPYYHQMLGAAIIHPDLREVIPFMPETDCETRWYDQKMIVNAMPPNASWSSLRQDHPHLNFICH